ncbi:MULTISPECIES: hypothetical protein [Methanobrevibacter]|uniref:Uncharacterized protein n=1 Tax=Methanobrevibacter gottschalkii DSM 11977 TaxID=1122229 RepID=A0A3N5BAJ2_9EURY|nr:MULTISPECIES: hypothetical protein [Methanobrevibacter]OEC93751.1 hypothetical protein A9505_09030 [Methanobrevibacter sp. A27]RPF52480.1 hypothetical protein EDC42_0009 [Methanobrevibacter gottschalkii DSM 11977]
MKNLIKINVDFEELDNYKFIMDEPFSLEVNYNHVKYNFIIKFSSNNNNLICCAPGAQDRNKRTSQGELIKPPYFDRWSWFKYFEESFIAFSDPIFYYDKEITLGWCVGDKNQWYAENISLIIQKLAKNQEIINENILFFASSGGGFVSIILATLIKGSKCVVNNSQFSIFNFYETHINRLFKFLENSFRLNKSEITDKIDYRLDLIKLFKKENYMPSITYYVNACSKYDIKYHAMPFIENVMFIPQFKDNLNVHYYHEYKDFPHNPMSTDKILVILKNFIKINLYNNF